MATSKKFIPGSDADGEEIFQYSFLSDDESREFIEIHGKIMFIVRGPPGTGKSTLTDMIVQRYPSGVKCRADDYFTKTFASSLRTKESLKEAHMYCHKRVKQECQKGTHPVIVSNTHVKKFEMQEYLNYAQEYGYIVIIANTLDKFEVSPEILAKSNTKGLDKQYFKHRMKAWQEIFPILMGWFLNGEDSSFLLNELQCALDALLGDGKFCRVFNAFDKDNLLNYYKAKEMLFCIAGFGKTHPLELKEYYKSTEIRDAYGKCFRLSVQAYVITESDIFAIVHLDDVLKSLVFKKNSEDYSHEEEIGADIIRAFSCMSLQQSYEFKFISLKSNFSQKCKTAVLEDTTNDCLNIDESSFIHIAQRNENKFSPWQLNKLLKSSFNDVVDDAGKLPADKFSELEEGYKSCRLHKDAWVIKPPKDFSVKTVFTGLYI